MTKTPTHPHKCRENYPTEYAIHTTNDRYCPRCGSEAITLISGFSSGRRIGVCHNCGENYVVKAWYEGNEDK